MHNNPRRYVYHIQDEAVCRKKLGITIRYPFSYSDYICPIRKDEESWEKSMKVLQALENMRFQSAFYRMAWNTATIRSVENGTNPYLALPIDLLAKYFYPFDITPDHFRQSVEIV